MGWHALGQGRVLLLLMVVYKQWHFLGRGRGAAIPGNLGARCLCLDEEKWSGWREDGSLLSVMGLGKVAAV